MDFSAMESKQKGLGGYQQQNEATKEKDSSIH